jgi:Leucine-rich repeat (LRR) protein
MMKRANLIFPLLLVLLLSACKVQQTGPCAAVTDIPDTECSALVSFYNVTNGDNWKDRRGWLESPQACDWFGVDCRAGHVTSISMNYININGELPAQLANLKQLETLSLYYNELSGSIPPELGELSSLRLLILHNNNLSGNLPVELGKLSELKLLDLESNELSGPIPAEFGNLTSLEELKLRDNRLSGSLPPELDRLSNLTGLFISNNDFSGDVPQEWVNLKKLRMFAAYGNEQLESIPDFLAGLPPDGYPAWANPNIP